MDAAAVALKLRSIDKKVMLCKHCAAYHCSMYANHQSPVVKRRNVPLHTQSVSKYTKQYINLRQDSQETHRLRTCATNEGRPILAQPMPQPFVKKALMSSMKTSASKYSAGQSTMRHRQQTVSDQKNYLHGSLERSRLLEGVLKSIRSIHKDKKQKAIDTRRKGDSTVKITAFRLFSEESNNGAAEKEGISINSHKCTIQDNRCLGIYCAGMQQGQEQGEVHISCRRHPLTKY